MAENKVTIEDIQNIQQQHDANHPIHKICAYLVSLTTEDDKAEDNDDGTTD